jgi:perosamine synthetase
MTIYKTHIPFGWYPPGETFIPVQSLVRALLPGPADFERDISNFLGAKACILGSSGRALLSQLLVKLKERTGIKKNKVLIPGYTCYSVAASVAKAGLRIVSYDLDPYSFHPRMDSVHAMAGPDTLAIIGQHLFGVPTPMEELLHVSRQSGAYFIEDAAQGFGGSLKGIPLGAIGDFGLFSFGRGKPLPLGSGGALIGKAEILTELSLEEVESGYADLALAIAGRLLSHKKIYGLLETLPLGLGKTVFDTRFSLQAMPKLIKRLGKRLFMMMAIFNEHRYAIAGLYQRILEGGRTPTLLPESRPVFTRFPVMAGIKHIPKALFQLGVRRMYPKAILDEPAIRPFCAPVTMTTPGSTQIAEMLITLPTHRGITSDVGSVIAEGVKEAYLW